jgi:hypothetical protein
MAKFTFYCRVDRDRPAQGINAGVYIYRSEHDLHHLAWVPPAWVPKVRILIQHSSKVWRQGPRGGVKIIKNRDIGSCGYVTTNEDQMKEFVWIKLQARAV